MEIFKKKSSKICCLTKQSSFSSKTKIPCLCFFKYIYGFGLNVNDCLISIFQKHSYLSFITREKNQHFKEITSIYRLLF